jgi:hypothetical protein
MSPSNQTSMTVPIGVSYIVHVSRFVELPAWQFSKSAYARPQHFGGECPSGVLLAGSDRKRSVEDTHRRYLRCSAADRNSIRDRH